MYTIPVFTRSAGIPVNVRLIQTKTSFLTRATTDPVAFGSFYQRGRSTGPFFLLSLFAVCGGGWEAGCRLFLLLFLPGPAGKAPIYLP